LLIARYLTREAVQTFAAVALVLMLVFLSGTLVKILAQVASGDLPTSLLATLFAYKAIGNLVLVIPLALFLGVMLALGRLYTDHEMVAMFACGLSPQQVMRIVAKLASVIAVLVALLVLLVAPWAEREAQRVVARAAAANPVEGLVAGRFNTLGAGEGTLYFERAESAGVLHNIFIEFRSADQITLINAARGRHEQRGGAEYLILYHGFQSRGKPGGLAYEMISFDRQGIHLPKREIEAESLSRRARSSAELWHATQLEERVELQWRLAIPISTLLFALLGVALGRTTPRQGRYAKLMLGIVIYLVYNNALTFARDLVMRGDLSPQIGLWWVHLLLITVIFTLFRPTRVG
jgi:lipopolysaccharide export system permease protein